MRRVLIVSYYFPPAGGPGVQRVMGVVRHLRTYGWEPVVLTVDGGTFFNRDEGALSLVPPGVEVYRTRTVEPFALYNRLRGRAGDEPLPVGHVGQGTGILSRCASFVRANVFIPDGRIGWVPFGLRAATRIVKERNIDVVLTSGPPHSTHLIGRGLARSSGVPWVADFRDPWTQVFYNAYVKRTSLARWVDRWLEQQVVRQASALIAIDEDTLRSLGPGADGGQIVSNGFEEDDFQDEVEPVADRFELVYIGNLIAHHHTATLFRVIREVVDARQGSAGELRLVLVGNVHPGARQELEALGLTDHTEFTGFVTHPEAVRRLRSATVCLFIGAGDVLSAKIFEYAATGRPMLTLAPLGGPVDRFMVERNLPRPVDHTDADGIRAQLEGLVRAWRDDALPTRPPMSGVSDLTRSALSGRIAGVLEDALRRAEATAGHSREGN